VAFLALCLWQERPLRGFLLSHCPASLGNENRMSFALHCFPIPLAQGQQEPLCFAMPTRGLGLKKVYWIIKFLLITSKKGQAVLLKNFLIFGMQLFFPLCLT